MDNQNVAIGSQADLESGVQMSRVFNGYFSDEAHIKNFCEIAFKNIVDSLLSEIRYADFGAVEGDVTKVVSDWLENKGF